MKPIKVRFIRFEGGNARSPIFEDPDGNEYFWQESENLDMQVAGRHFWDEIGYNERLRYKITFIEINGKRYISGVYGLK